MTIDIITSYLYRAIDILLLRSPERTAYGILMGVVFLGVKDSIAELFTGKFRNAFESLNYISVFCFGIVIVRLDILFKREPLDKVIVTQLNTLKFTINAANFSEAEKKLLYRDFIQRIYNDIDIKEQEDTQNKTGTEQVK